MRVSKKFTAVYINDLRQGDKSYYVGYTDITGRWVKVKIGNKSHGLTEIYANAKRIEYINMIRLGEDPLAYKKKKELMTFDVVSTHYFSYLKAEAKKDTYNPENRYRLHIKKSIGNKSISHITRADIVAIKDRMLKTHSTATTRHIVSLIATIFNFAISSDNVRFTGKNVAEGLVSSKDLKLDNSRERYLSGAEVSKLLLAIKDDVEVNLFVRLSLSTGGRLNTVLNLKRKDFRGRDITLFDFKGKKTYSSFLSEQLFLDQLFLKDLKPNDYVIGKKVELYSQRKIQRRLKEVLDKLFNVGLENDDAKNRVVIHTLRHSFASLLVIAGTPIYEVMKLMNHSSIDMTMRYAKLAPDSGKKAINNMFHDIGTAAE